MSNFYEENLFEFKPIIKRRTWRKEIRYRFRIVKRKDWTGISRIFLDLREFKLDEKKAVFTENGLYFTLDELRYLSDVIRSAIDYMAHPEKMKK